MKRKDKIKQFLKYYFGNMPRDKRNYKFRWQEALFYTKWCIEFTENWEKTFRK